MQSQWYQLCWIPFLTMFKLCVLSLLLYYYRYIIDRTKQMPSKLAIRFGGGVKLFWRYLRSSTLITRLRWSIVACQTTPDLLTSMRHPLLSVHDYIGYDTTLSLIEWYLMRMCFDFWWKTGFSASFNDDSLSPSNSTLGFPIPNSSWSCCK